MWRSSFLVNLQACRLITNNFTIKWTASQVFFSTILSLPPILPPCFELSPPPPPSSIKFWRAPHYLTTCGKPWSFIMTKPQCSMCWLFNYFSRFVNIFLCYFFSKAGFKKWETKQNESLYTPNIFHLAQEVMFTKHTFTS